MVLVRPFLAIFLLAAPLGGGAFAAPLGSDGPDANPLVEQAQRKGTRNYRPDGSDPAAADAGTQASTVSKNEKLDQCMDTWDKGTHITKSKWREICLRQLDARE
jgi:hypothetical protein